MRTRLILSLFVLVVASAPVGPCLAQPARRALPVQIAYGAASCPARLLADGGLPLGVPMRLTMAPGDTATITLPHSLPALRPGRYTGLLLPAAPADTVALPIEVYIVADDTLSVVLAAPEGRCGPTLLAACRGRYALPGYTDARAQWQTPTGQSRGDTVPTAGPGLYVVARAGPGGCPIRGSYTLAAPLDTSYILALDEAGRPMLGDTLEVEGDKLPLRLATTKGVCQVAWMLDGAPLPGNGLETDGTTAKSGRYLIRATYTGLDQCIYQAERSIFIYSLALPNLITANQDLRNEVFADPAGPWRITVYDRWGHQVHTADDVAPWPQTFTPTGTYYYHASRPGSTRRGWVEVVR